MPRWSGWLLGASVLVGVGLFLLDAQSVDSPSAPAAEAVQTSGARGADSSPSVAPDRAKGSAHVAAEAPSQVHAQRPLAMSLPSGISVPIELSSTSTTGELVLPRDINRAGWWDGSSRLGDPFGATVVAAHVDSFQQGLGVFSELLSARTGDRVVVTSRNHRQEYTVVSARLVSKQSLSSTSALYSSRGEPRLVLITCGGPYDPDHGYRDNMVVLAEPSGDLLAPST